MSHWPSQPSPFIPSDGQSVGYAVRGDDARADDVQADDTRPPTIVRGSRTQLHSPSPSSSTPTKRKRPKYTRSKNGCLTCRVKKIKCDEVHPVCTRCAQSQRECTWPSVTITQRPKTSQPPEENLYSPSGLSDHSTLSSSSSVDEVSPSPILLPDPPLPRISTMGTVVAQQPVGHGQNYTPYPSPHPHTPSPAYAYGPQPFDSMGLAPNYSIYPAPHDWQYPPQASYPPSPQSGQPYAQPDTNLLDYHHQA